MISSVKSPLLMVKMLKSISWLANPKFWRLKTLFSWLNPNFSWRSHFWLAKYMASQVPPFIGACPPPGWFSWWSLCTESPLPWHGRPPLISWRNRTCQADPKCGDGDKGHGRTWFNEYQSVVNDDNGNKDSNTGSSIIYIYNDNQAIYPWIGWEHLNRTWCFFTSI